VDNTPLAASGLSHGTYTISTARSTGAFARAIGHGTITLSFSAMLPKPKNGTCDMNPNAVPGTARATDVIRGPLTLK
jgi:hypothetical protein